MRLQRALARAGVASRRAAEQLIEAGKVRVDGKPATLGMKVDPERQRITVSGRPVRLQARRRLAFYQALRVATLPAASPFTSRSAWSPPRTMRKGAAPFSISFPSRPGSPTSDGST